MLDQTISHYRITQKLGAGGMGVVYKATDLQLERTVALKFLPHEIVVSESDKERLLREARSASALDHPNIGVIHGIEESNDKRLFIVMAYYEGDTLAQRLSRGVLSVRESLDLAIQIARGLGAAHARNIVHRDIKPSNIIITQDNVAKIVDFGLARVVASASATQSMSLTGTLPYMAPEQILGEPIDQRSDVWALGVILVQMITGSHPFVRTNTAAMTFAILNQPPAALDAVPETIRPLIYKALSKKPEHRHTNADELLKDLESARAEITSTPAPLDEPTLTRAVTPREMKKIIENASTPRWNQERPRSPVRLLLPVLGLVVILAAVFFLPAMRERLAGLVYASTEKHIAVLPFENVGNDPEYEPVAHGLMDALTNELSNLDAAQKSLWVVPASEVRKHNITDAASAFRDLGATMVVQGSVQRKGSAVYLTVVLIDSKRLRQIGSAQLEDNSGDLAIVQNDAVAHLARMMKVKMPDTSLESAKATPGSYESYLKALGFMQRYDKPGNVDSAIAALNSAVNADPRFALAYASLCNAYRLKYVMESDPALIAQASANCEKAAKLDERLPAVHVNLGLLNATEGKNDIALQEYQKALDMNPRDADAIMSVAGIYERLNRIPEAEANYKRAIALRPDYWNGYVALALFYGRQKRVDDAIAQLKRVIEITPDNATAYSNLGAEYMALPDNQGYPAAEAAFKKSLQIVPNYAAYSNLGYLYFSVDRYAEAVPVFRQALALNDKDWRVWANLFVSYQWLKDDVNIVPVRKKTIELLETTISVTPQNAKAHSMLSILYASDDREKALSHVRTALALEPKNPDVLSDIAVTYEALGDRQHAIQSARDSLANGGTLSDFQGEYGLQNVLADPSFRSGGKK
jgi:serine/threonine-protein kinase